MSLSTTAFLLTLLPTSPLVTLITLIGLGALGAGTFSLTFPSQALQIYGISLHKSPRDVRQATTSTPTPTTTTSAQDFEPIARSLSIRNFTLGVSILTVTAYWQKQIGAGDVEAGRVVQTCLGYFVTVGSVVPATDAYGAWRDGGVGRLRVWMTVLHCLRFCVWIWGGVWCLTG